MVMIPYTKKLVVWIKKRSLPSLSIMTNKRNSGNYAAEPMTNHNDSVQMLAPTRIHGSCGWLSRMYRQPLDRFETVTLQHIWSAESPRGHRAVNNPFTAALFGAVCGCPNSWDRWREFQMKQVHQEVLWSKHVGSLMFAIALTNVMFILNRPKTGFSSCKEGLGIGTLLNPWMSFPTRPLGSIQDFVKLQ